MNDLIATIEQMQAEAREGMKRASRDSDPYLYQYLVGKFHAFGKVAGILKKQKEQKPTEIDEYKIIKKHITEDSLSSEVNKRLKECGWYVTDTESSEWSEEDEGRLINTSISFLKDFADKGYENAVECIDWLKSLRDRPKQPEVFDTVAFQKGVQEGRRLEKEDKQ